MKADRKRKGAKAAAAKEAEEEEAPKKAVGWRNRERVLVFCSRGVSYRDRHLMQDLRTLLPHSKAESKMDKNQPINWINEMAEMRNATKVLYFECRKKKDLFLWLAAPPSGPSAKFLLHNVHTMQELRLAGNCLVGSRPLLSFDDEFGRSPELSLLRELMVQTLGTPKGHPRSQPFLDHVLHFGLSDDRRIWIRNYQIVSEGGELEEVGPRLVLELIKIFEGSFSGEVLYENPAFVHPNDLRRRAKLVGKNRYMERVEARKDLEHRRATETTIAKTDPLDDVFETNPAKLRRLDDGGDDEIKQEPSEGARIAAGIQKKGRKRKRKAAAPTAAAQGPGDVKDESE